MIVVLPLLLFGRIIADVDFNYVILSYICLWVCYTSSRSSAKLKLIKRHLKLEVTRKELQIQLDEMARYLQGWLLNCKEFIILGFTTLYPADSPHCIFLAVK